MKIDLNENDMMLTTIIMLAGALAFIALKQMEVLNNSYPVQQYGAVKYNIPVLEPMQMIEPAQYDEPMVIVDDVPVEMPDTSPVVYRSPATFMGYNVDDDLVSIARRLPSGEVVRRKIRDPDVAISDLSVDKWVEFNDYEKETDMTWA